MTQKMDLAEFKTTNSSPDPRIEPRFPALQADSLPSEPPGKPPIKIDIMVILIQDGNVSKDSPVFQPCPSECHLFCDLCFGLLLLWMVFFCWSGLGHLLLSLWQLSLAGPVDARDVNPVLCQQLLNFYLQSVVPIPPQHIPRRIHRPLTCDTLTQDSLGLPWLSSG